MPGTEHLMDRTANQTLRRYPALGFLAVAAALALILPSRLTTPRSNPGTLAEFAPVPGRGEGAGDLSELGAVEGRGLGAGRGPAAGKVGANAGRDRGPGNPSSTVKRCVGKPLRQTEDPLSPPCVAFFDGDNGGATVRGVTGDEIRIVLFFGGSSDEKLIDYGDPNARDPNAQDDAWAPVARAFVRYFNERYQLYKRKAHVWGYRGPSTTPETLRAAIDTIIQRVDPFAIVPTTVSGTAIAREAAARGVLAPSYTALDRRLQQQVAPLLITYAPDLQDEARLAASFVCTKLARRDARFSGNIDDRARPRKFGVLYIQSAEEPEWELSSQLFLAELRTQCGIDDVPAQPGRQANGTPTSPQDYAVGVANLRTSNVTTVVMFGGNAAGLTWSNAAASQSWYPEWLVPGAFLTVGTDTNLVARQMNPLVWANAFGISYDYRRGPVADQQWYQAYQEGCGGCGAPTPDARTAKAYDVLVELFWGIQAAGPKLTPANIDKGLHAIPARPSQFPTVPAAYFAPGNYSWVKDAMAIWWDASGTEPGTGARGCYRLARDGRRSRAGEWEPGDGDLKTGTPACQGPDR